MAEEEVAAAVVAEEVAAAAVAVAPSKLLSKPLSKPQVANPELRGQRHRLPARKSAAGLVEAAALEAAAADLASLPASTQLRFRPAVRTLPERSAFRRIRESKSRSLTARSGRML